MKFSVKIIIALAVAYASTAFGQTTQPAIDVPSFTAGYNTRDAGLPNPYAATQPTTAPTSAPSTMPTTAPTSQPTIATLPSGTDLNIINSASPNDTITLTPGVTYTATGTITPPSGLTLNSTGASIKFVGATAEAANLNVVNPSFLWYGGTVAAGNLVVNNFQGSTIVHDVTVANNAVAKFWINNDGAQGAMLKNCTIGDCSDEMIYGTSGMQLINDRFGSSHGQPMVRGSPDSNGNISLGWFIDSCTFDQSNNGTNNNEALTIRRGTGTIQNCTFGVDVTGKPTSGTYARFGEIPSQTPPGTKPGTNCPTINGVAGIVFNNNSFVSLKQGFNCLTIKCGVQITVDGLWAMANADSVPISLSPDMSSTLTVKRVYRVPTGPGLKLKPNDVGPSGTRWLAGVLTESGSAIVPIWPPVSSTFPATQSSAGQQ